jgi:hypothetical protein
MKKVLIMAIIVAIAYVSSAQTAGERTVKGSKVISKDSTPQQVIDTLRKRFPNAEAVHYYQTSAAVANGWAVSTEDNLAQGADVNYYTIKFKRKDFQYYGLFEADGTLVKSEYQLVDVALPDPVVATLKKLGAEKYKGYMIISKNYWKQVDHKKNKEYYVIRAVNKNDYKQAKTILLDPAGNIIKEE